MRIFIDAIDGLILLLPLKIYPIFLINMIIEYLFYIFLVATLIQLLYHVLIFIRIWFYKESEQVNYKPVSVILS